MWMTERRASLQATKKIFPGWVHFADTAKLLTFEKMWPHFSLQSNVSFLLQIPQRKKVKGKVLCQREEKISDVNWVKIISNIWNCLLKTTFCPIFAGMAEPLFTLPTVTSICAQWEINGSSFPQQATIWQKCSLIRVNKVISNFYFIMADKIQHKELQPSNNSVLSSWFLWCIIVPSFLPSHTIVGLFHCYIMGPNKNRVFFDKLTVITHTIMKTMVLSGIPVSIYNGNVTVGKETARWFYKPIKLWNPFWPPGLLNRPTRDIIIQFVYRTEMIHSIVCIILWEISQLNGQSQSSTVMYRHCWERDVLKLLVSGSTGKSSTYTVVLSTTKQGIANN